jgi:aminoethylphosphonate catabolism LysR family transcriptional regulator
MNLTRLRAFHSVAANGGITAAARALRVSQPAVTAQVRALEAEHGVELFVRRPRGVELTALGRTLFTVTEQLFGCAEQAGRLLHDAAALGAGRLRIGADNPYQLLPLLREFRRRAPAVAVEVELGNSRAIIDRIDAFAVDVALVAVDTLEPDWFALELGRDPIVVVIPAGHPWAKRASVHLTALHGQSMIRREPGSRTQAELDRACAAAGVAPRFELQLGSREALREAIAAGLGIGVISAAELGGDPRLRAVEIAGVTIRLRPHVICAAARRRAPLIRAFLPAVPRRKRR